MANCKQILKKMSLCIVITILWLDTTAQDANPADYTKVIDLLPPSPNAASLGKFGGFEPNLSSGMMHFELPIFTYESINLKVPLSLVYTSGGIRVDEIGGRVGMSWNLNAGGVITRTVLGRIDEMGNRVSYPTGNIYSQEYYDYLFNLTTLDQNGGINDSQPDIFSFNFLNYTGKFILDSSLNPILLTYSNIKIEPSFSPSSQFLFKITTADGVQYFFGGDSATEITSASQLGSACGKIYKNPAGTAFYLTSIVHPDNDTVTFSYRMHGSDYKTGLSQSTFYLPSQIPQTSCPGQTWSSPSVSPTTCLGWMHTSMAYLESINSSSGNKVVFKYTGRNDDDDSLLSSIEIYQTLNSQPIRKYIFGYQYSIAGSTFANTYSSTDSKLNYRPFLTGFSEKSADLSLGRGFLFSYLNINSLPPRISYAQDDYGFFNGKANTTLIPVPTDPLYKTVMSGATANRNTDSVYSMLGLLNRIIYPTGGQDSVIYGAHTGLRDSLVYPPSQLSSASAANYTTGGSTKQLSSIITPGFDQQALITSNCSLLPGYSADAIHDKAIITLTDLGSGAALFSQPMDPVNLPVSNLYVTLYAGRTYQISVTSYGNGVSAISSTYYYSGQMTSTPVMKVVCGGGRVAKIITQSDKYSLPIIKCFYYNDYNANSSAVILYAPAYQKNLTVSMPCDGGFPGQCGKADYSYFSMYSNSTNNLYLLGISPISYSKVLESNGQNFENGGIEHNFLIARNVQGALITGEMIIGMPFSDYSWRNGREVYQCTFKTLGNLKIPVKKVYTHFKEDLRPYGEIKYYVCNRRFTWVNCEPNTDFVRAESVFDLSSYSLFRTWVYPDTIRTVLFAKNGIDSIQNITSTEYGNVQHAMPTKITHNLSDGRVDTVLNFYPYDIVLTGSAETGRQSLISKYMIGTVLKQQTAKGSTTTNVLSKEYNLFSNGLTKNRSLSVQVLTNPPEKRIDFTKYNLFGKITEQFKTNDQKNSIIWDYKSMYPVANVNNADSSDIAYNSFEADGNGNWSFSGMATPDVTSPTGVNCYLISQRLIKTGLNTSTTYIVSYWAKAGSSVSVSGSPGIKQGKTIGSWTFFEDSVKGVNSITISGTGYVDEVRLYPSTAQMITSTYSPLVGITSKCDADNKITYYFYDGIGRLSYVKDQDGNIIKTLEYKYAQN